MREIDLRSDEGWLLNQGSLSRIPRLLRVLSAIPETTQQKIHGLGDHEGTLIVCLREKVWTDSDHAAVVAAWDAEHEWSIEIEFSGDLHE